jgi:hypothetical protein
MIIINHNMHIYIHHNTYVYTIYTHHHSGEDEDMEVADAWSRWDKAKPAGAAAIARMAKCVAMEARSMRRHDET